MTLLNDNCWLKANFVKNLRTFFLSYKKALENFTQAVQKANVQLDKDFLKQMHEMT